MVKSNEKQPFDILNHELVPFHEIISEKERTELLKKYNITTDQLPKIISSDPVAVFVGAKPGQIVKITRESRTAKETEAYRLVVESNE